MTNRFFGDPKIYITADGADLNFIGGQPVMDAGLENLAIISLFTSPGWWGNALITDANKQIGSNFERDATGTITLTSLNNTRQSAEKALKNPAFGQITVDVSNPSGNRTDVTALIKPPGRDIEELRVSKNGVNWQAQALCPASKGVSECQ